MRFAPTAEQLELQGVVRDLLDELSSPAVVRSAPDSRAGARFVDIVLGPAGKAILRRHGFN